MTDDSLEPLWRGSDPAKFTALQAALRDEEIPFWQTQVYDPAGGFLSSRPYYLEATPGFEIRVRSSDFERASSALAWVESKVSNSESFAGASKQGPDPLDSRQSLPTDWDPNEATSEVWSGDEEAMAEYLASALRENGVPSRIPMSRATGRGSAFAPGTCSARVILSPRLRIPRRPSKFRK